MEKAKGKQKMNGRKKTVRKNGAAIKLTRSKPSLKRGQLVELRLHGHSVIGRVG
jgi:hypothetical protein